MTYLPVNAADWIASQPEDVQAEGEARSAPRIAEAEGLAKSASWPG